MYVRVCVCMCVCVCVCVCVLSIWISTSLGRKGCYDACRIVRCIYMYGILHIRHI